MIGGYSSWSKADVVLSVTTELRAPSKPCTPSHTNETSDSIVDLTGLHIRMPAGSVVDDMDGLMINAHYASGFAPFSRLPCMNARCCNENIIPIVQRSRERHPLSSL